MQATTGIESDLRTYVVTAFLGGEDTPDLTPDTDLVKTAVVDSINVLRLVEFMEDTYDIMLEPHELHRLISLKEITAVIQEKLAE